MKGFDMSICKGPLKPVLLAALSLLLWPAWALAQQEGNNFRTLSPPQPTENPGKIEVTEFFSYACPHCNEFYPLLTAWLAKQKKDVVLRRVPVGYERPPWIALQHAYYALESDGDLPKLDAALFSAIHQQQRRLFDEQSLADWVGANGGDSAKFASAFSSFGVNSQVAQADKMSDDYGVAGVPTMAVDGKYVALGDTHEQILANVDALVAKVRAQHPTAGAASKPK
jgi:thiol:disulfide interchange protein DsbA